MQPSASPSDSPSRRPSSPPTAAPSVSQRPSNSPSKTPSLSPTDSPSASPSHQPTFIRQVDATLKIAFKQLSKKLNQTQQQAFEDATAEWIVVAFPGLSDASVSITKQAIVNITTVVSSSGSRLLSESVLPAIGLEITFIAVATFAGPNDFSLYETLKPPIDKKDPSWTTMLWNNDPVFEPVAPPSRTPNAVTSGVRNSSSKGVGPGGIFAVTLVVLCAVVLGVGASVYSVRTHQMAARGDTLPSPRDSHVSSPQIARVPTEDLIDPNQDWGSTRSSYSYYGGQRGFSPGALASSVEIRQSDGSKKVAVKANSSFRMISMPSVSPNSMENARISSDTFTREAARASNDKDESSSIQFRRPSNSSGEEVKRQASVPMQATTQHESSSPTDSRITNDIVDTSGRYISRLGPQLDKAGKRVAATIPQKLPGRQNDPREPSTVTDYTAQAHEFIKSFIGGTGALAPRDPSVVGGGYKASNNAPSPGKRHAQAEVSHTLSSFDSVVRRAGLYDVFAPAGPIGIVVDTTKDGPAVHSLKGTSPMLGLMNPGDLIVGLDDEDTRGMTAATLTRLMAKKAHQKERKITLLAIDS
jgi:hypothetical protein